MNDFYGFEHTLLGTRGSTKGVPRLFRLRETHRFFSVWGCTSDKKMETKVAVSLSFKHGDGRPT